MEYYKIIWASASRHEHWYRTDANRVIDIGTCILQDPGARCLAPMWRPGEQLRGARVVLIRTPPAYVLERFEYVESF